MGEIDISLDTQGVEMNSSTASITIAMPEFVAEDVAAVGTHVPKLEDRMRLLNTLAAHNVEAGTGGPFAALVVDQATGELISVAVNAVLLNNQSVCHAEVMALTFAESKLNSWNIGAAVGAGAELDVNWRPCVQCYGATMWSGVNRLVIAGEGPELEELTGFDEGPMVDDWQEQFEQRGIHVEVGVLRDEAIDVFKDYQRRVADGSVTVYNGHE